MWDFNPIILIVVAPYASWPTPQIST